MKFNESGPLLAFLSAWALDWSLEFLAGAFLALAFVASWPGLRQILRDAEE